MTPAEKRKAIGLGGLALVGLGLGLYFEQQQPTPKPPPPPAPPPPSPPPPSPPPAPAGRTQTVCGCAPDAAGVCSTWCSTLWGIAQHWYGNGALYPRIYAANAALIEATAQAHGFATSGGGHWIFPGMVLTIP